MALHSVWQNLCIGSRTRTVVLVLGNLAVWAHVAWFILHRKLGFFDDAYVYLQIANNVLETGTARFFPLNHSWALLASSPLRLLVLLPAVFCSRLLADPRSVEAARLAFLFSGPMSALIFMPFFRRRRHLWGLGLFGSGILAVCTESALQMEGLLLYWILLVLAQRSSAHWSETPRQLGILVALLILTRPEFGVFAVAWCAVWVARSMDTKRLGAWSGGLLIVALAWVAVAVALRVYPLPTTYLSKIVTGRLELFGPSFGSLLPARIGTYFLGGEHRPAMLVWALSILVAAAVATGSWRQRLIGVLLLLVCLVSWQAGGNYLWYFENICIGLVALVVGRILAMSTWSSLNATRRIAAAWLAVVLAMFVGGNWDNAERTGIWSLRSESSVGFAYRNIGQAYGRDGLFEFRGTEPSYLVMMEIGMVSYFGGRDVWLFDRGGLAQPGTLDGVREHVLARLYPSALLSSASEELMRLNTEFGRAYAWPPIWKAWAISDDATGRDICGIYLPDKAICLQAVSAR